jgi:hypothetical protein
MLLTVVGAWEATCADAEERAAHRRAAEQYRNFMIPHSR